MPEAKLTSEPVNGRCTCKPRTLVECTQCNGRGFDQYGVCWSCEEGYRDGEPDSQTPHIVIHHEDCRVGSDELTDNEFVLFYIDDDNQESAKSLLEKESLRIELKTANGSPVMCGEVNFRIAGNKFVCSLLSWD